MVKVYAEMTEVALLLPIPALVCGFIPLWLTLVTFTPLVMCGIAFIVDLFCEHKKETNGGLEAG